MKTENLLSIWGAITGTVACANLVWNWHHDRARLNINAHISHNNTGSFLNIQAVNNGRRPIRVQRVSVLTAKTFTPFPMKLTDTPLVHLKESTVNLNVAENGQSLQLGADGDQRNWTMPIVNREMFETHKKMHIEHGKGFVTLTSGKKIIFDFEIPPKDFFQC